MTPDLIAAWVLVGLIGGLFGSIAVACELDALRAKPTVRYRVWVAFVGAVTVWPVSLLLLALASPFVLAGLLAEHRAPRLTRKQRRELAYRAALNAQQQEYERLLGGTP